MTLDLGCGDSKRGDVGIDLYPQDGVDHPLALGFQDIPYAPYTFERVFAYDFLEHLPKVVWMEPEIWIPHYPHIKIFNDVWQVLDKGGVFETLTPLSGDHVHGRIFHHSEWNLDTFKQFTQEGTDFKRGMMQQAGFMGCFKIILHDELPFGHIRVDLKKVEIKA